MNVQNQSKHITAFVSKNYQYYMHQWAKFENLDRKISWNWPAFFFGWSWMMYRKMYIPALVLFIIEWVVLECSRFFLVDFSLTNILLMGISVFVFYVIYSICTGLFGNYVYYLHASKKITTVLDSMGTDTHKIIEHNVRKVGGTSWLAMWASLLGVIGFALVFNVLTANP